MNMINVAGIVDRALRTAGIPFDGVSIGDEGNRATWRVVFSASATPAQRTAAAAILTTVAVDATAQLGEDQAVAQIGVDSLGIIEKAIVLALIDQLNVIRAALVPSKPPITPAQALAAIRAKAGTL